MQKTPFLNHRAVSVIAFSFFNAWLLSFAYEGQILYSLFDSYHIDPGSLMLAAIISHAAGLFACGLLVKNINAAKKLMLAVAGLCAAASAVFFFAPSALWTVLLIAAAFLSGMWNAAWGWFYRCCALPGQRMVTVAASIAGGTTLMIGLNLAATHFSAQAGLGLAMLCLAASLFFTARLPKNETEPPSPEPAARIPARRALMLLCLFIIVLTINSGLMFQVVNPAFAHLTALTSWYWAVPYIAALVFVAWLPQRVNRSYILYAAIAMQGFGFILFLLLDRSAGSYFVVNTLLLGAFGINDLFWWSILGEMLDFYRNPAKVLGAGLFVNVLGVLLGETISGVIPASGSAPSLLGLAVVCAALVILPPLHKQLTDLLTSSRFLTTTAQLPPKEQWRIVQTELYAAGLTERENQAVALLLKGYTYRLIAQELQISVSTVKTHVQNIYFKLGIRSKTELVKKLAK